MICPVQRPVDGVTVYGLSAVIAAPTISFPVDGRLILRLFASEVDRACYFPVFNNSGVIDKIIGLSQLVGLLPAQHADIADCSKKPVV